ncbi:MAG: MFS transporter [Eubacteriales bacterium]|nr:MFS transporter [Eubacteriales bacterium]
MRNTEEGMLTRRMKLAYGSGDAACNIVIGMLSTVLTLFYTDYIGISPVVIGMVMLVSRILDGIATLVMGFIAERTDTKYGKYRPWILWMSLPYALSIVLLFTVPATTSFLQAIYIFITYNLCTTVVYTALNIPYGSLAYVMTSDPADGERLSAARMTLASVGRMLAVSGTLPLVKLWGNNKNAWVRTSLIWAVLAVILLLFCFFGCRERVITPVRDKPKNIFGSMKTAMANVYFWIGAGFQILQHILFAVTGTILPFYCKYVFHDDTWMYSGLYFLETGVLVIVMLFSRGLIERFGKRKASLAGIMLVIAGQLLLFPNPTSLTPVVVSCVLRGIGYAPLNAVLFAFLGEGVEYGYRKTKLRQESLMYALSSTFTKIAAGLTAALMTGLLSASGYITAAGDGVNTVQPGSAVDMIINIYRFGPLAILLVTAVILYLYRTPRELIRNDKI